MVSGGSYKTAYPAPLCYNGPMRVALNGYFWDRPCTGSGQYLRHLWSELRELAHKSGDSFDLVMPPASTLGLPANGLDLQAIRAPSRNPLTGRSDKLDKLLWEQWEVSAAAKKQKAQLLHSPYLSAPVFKSVPTVVTAHDMIPWVAPGYKSSFGARLYLALALVGVRRANLIIADSDASRRDVLRVLKVEPRKVHTVYLGVEKPPDYTPQQLDEVRARFGLANPFAFYMGGFDRRKSVPLLLRAWKGALMSLGEGSALAIGGALPQPGGVFPDVRAEAASLGFDGERGPVRFLGPLAEEDKPLLMAAARLFVYPSAYEGFGLDPLAAMSVGCPVISSHGGSLNEVVGDAGLLVSPNNKQELTTAIVRLWQDSALRADLRVKGKERAAGFTWRRTAQQTYNLYSLALQQSARRRE